MSELSETPQLSACGTPAGYARHRRLRQSSCQPCLAAAREYNRAHPSKNPPPTVAEGWVPTTHGKAWVYSRGCRCDLCRRAATEATRRNGGNRRSQDRRHAERVVIDGRLVHPDPWGGHGSIGAYATCGCRCDACRAAKAAYERGRR